jgi:hypothetical protein
MKSHIVLILWILSLSQTLFAQSPVISADHDLLQGRWFQACQAGGMRTEEFQDALVTLTEMFFLDAGCTRPSVIFISEGSFVLPTKDQMDFQFTSVRIRLMSEIAVNDFNHRRVCDFEDWTYGVEKEISGRSCAVFVAGLPHRVPAVGEMRFGLYRLEGNHLSFGKLSREKNATTPEKRPTEYDSRFYTKIPRAVCSSVF